MRLVFSQFAGEVPRIAAHRLPDGAAQYAENCRFERGMLAPAAAAALAASFSTGTNLAAFNLGGSWLKWAEDVDVVQIRDIDSSYKFIVSGLTGQPRKATLAMAIGGPDPTSPTDTLQLGVPAPAVAPSVSFVNTVADDAEVAYSTAYRYTRLSSWDEESAPSPPMLAEVKVGQYTQVQDLDWGEPDTNIEIVKLLVYRQVTTGSASRYLLAGEVLSGTTFNDVNTVGNGLIPDTELFQVLQTMDWDEPPAGLKGITKGPGNMFMGFIGNTVRFSVPDFYHAWPTEYAFAMPDEIIALLPAGPETAIVLTDSLAYRLTGRTPASISQAPLPGSNFSCRSRRAAVSTPVGIFHDTSQGPAITTPERTTILDGLFTPEQWNATSPENHYYAYFNNKVYCFIRGVPGAKHFKADIRSFDSITHFTVGTGGDENFTMEAAYCDGTDLFVLGKGADGINRVYALENGATAMQGEYRTREERFTPEVNLGYARVRLEGDTTITIYGKGATVLHSEAISGDTDIPLPFDATTDRMSVGFAGTGIVESVVVATSFDELNG